MFKTLRTIFLGRAAREVQSLETQNAVIIIEQKIREAEAGQALAKRGLAALLTRSKSESKSLAFIDTRITDLESRTKQALDAGQDALAYDGAKLLATLENERTIRRQTLTSADEKAARIRLVIEKTHRQLIDLRQGLITARAVEAERKAVTSIKGDLSAASALAEGEAVLERLLQSPDPIDEIEALEQIEADLSGDNVIHKMTEAGFGASDKIRPEDILARFKSESQKPKSRKMKAS